MLIGLNWNSLKEWKPYLWLAIPGVFMVCGEWWTFEIGGFVTGSVDGVQLAAYTITLNLASSGFVVRKLEHPHYYHHLHVHYVILWS